MAKTRTLQKKNFMDMFSGKQILIPIVALVLLAVFNLIADPSFYKITLDVNSAGNHVLSGYLITILDYGSELAILAIGMTLVTVLVAWTGYFCWCRYCDLPVQLSFVYFATICDNMQAL